MASSYRLSKKEEYIRVCYTREMLEHMPTPILHDICVKERIMTNSAGVSSAKLPRAALVDLILRYRGEKLPVFRPLFYNRASELLQLLTEHGREISASGVEVPVQICLYRNAALTLLDLVEVVLPQNEAYTHAFLKDGAGEVCALFRVLQKEEKTFLTMEAAWMDTTWEPGNYPLMELIFIGGDTAFFMASVYNGESPLEALFGKDLFYVRRRLEKLSILDFGESKAPLILDFGTSNTTAGYSNADGQTVLIRFKDYIPCKSCTNCGLCFLYPSATSVECCDPSSEANEVKLSFGDEALHERKTDGFKTFGTSFYDMKRFVGDFDAIVEVMDGEGYTARLTKLTIVRQYLLSVIKLSEEREKCKFRKLSFTTPVKQKVQMMSMLMAALPEYEVEDLYEVDEGMAVLYHELELLRKDARLTEREGKVLILDVGGGTSDLVSCHYRVKDAGISYRLSIDESYAGGDTNFGGNNLTYRILMYIKLKLFYQNEKKNVSSILPPDFYDPYNAVDDYGSSKELYRALEEEYQKAENWLPTRFADELLRSSVSYRKVRSNYYTLWNVSESLKKQFFQDTLVSEISVPDEAYGEEYGIFVRQDGELSEALLQLKLSKEEVLTVITPDIYALVKKLLEPLCDEDGILSGYSIKLSGQTCQIPVFREAVKEFTVGQRSRSRYRTRNWCGLKLKCIDGAVNAWRNREYGYILSDIKRSSSMTPYEVSAKTHTGREVILIPFRRRMDESYGYVSRPFGTKEIKFLFKSGEQDIGYEVRILLEAKDMEPVEYEDILAQFRETPLRQADLDTIEDGELRLFLMGDEDKWGINVIALGRKNEQLYLCSVTFIAFDTVHWNVDFFDGNK